MTNRQWLESLSDEELAKVIVHGYMHELFCDIDLSIACTGEPNQCDKCAKAWLQAEHKEE